MLAKIEYANYFMKWQNRKFGLSHRTLKMEVQFNIENYADTGCNDVSSFKVSGYSILTVWG